MRSGKRKGPDSAASAPLLEALFDLTPWLQDTRVSGTVIRGGGRLDPQLPQVHPGYCGIDVDISFGRIWPTSKGSLRQSAMCYHRPR